MRTADYLVNLVLSGVLIVGGYQFYFWCQRHALFEPRELSSKLDELIPYLPGWVWIYVVLYYPAIAYLILALTTPRAFTQAAASYMLLLALQVVCFLAFPVRTPASWRVSPGRTVSERFLAFVQRIDAPTNCFPSMHVSIAMLTALHLYHRDGIAVMALPVLMGLSCVFTKQHYLVDIPAGAALGWIAFALNAELLAT